MIATPTNATDFLSPASGPSFVLSGMNKKTLPLRAGSISYLEYKQMRFIINDCPSDQNLHEYIQAFKQFNVTDVVRVCEKSYSAAPLEEEGIRIHELKYEDGGVPPNAVIQAWLQLVEKRFGSRTAQRKSSSSSASESETSPETKPTIAVHCVAGLGRAPVLVAIALIEYGLDKLDAIDLIRKRRRGAFNSRQIQYIDNYKRQSSANWRLKSKLSNFFTFKRDEDSS